VRPALATGSTTPVTTAALGAIGLGAVFDAARAARMSLLDGRPLVRNGFPG